MTVSETIIEQLGGVSILSMMIGLKKIITEPNAVQLIFPLPKHKGAVNKVRIFLNGLDLYDIEFIRFNKRGHKVISKEENVYAEDLKDFFERGTGLYIRF